MLLQLPGILPFHLLPSQLSLVLSLVPVPAGPPSRGGDVVEVYVFDINQPSLPTTFHAVFVSISVCMAFSAVFYSINSPQNSPSSHFVLSVLLFY